MDIGFILKNGIEIKLLMVKNTDKKIISKIQDIDTGLI